MKPVCPRAIIFDWDNTLVESWGAIAEAVNFVRARYGLPVWTMPEVIANCTRSARENFPLWFGDQWQKAWQDYYDCFEQIRKKTGLHPTSGAVELLTWLNENKIPAVVVSNKLGDYLRQESTELGWNHFFVSLVGSKDTAHDKPAREPADYALSLAGLKGGTDIWFVGDADTDMFCARNTGCMPYLIGTKESAQKLGIDMFAADCREILGLLKNGCPLKA